MAIPHPLPHNKPCGGTPNEYLHRWERPMLHLHNILDGNEDYALCSGGEHLLVQLCDRSSNWTRLRRPHRVFVGVPPFTSALPYPRFPYKSALLVRRRWSSLSIAGEIVDAQISVFVPCTCDPRTAALAGFPGFSALTSWHSGKQVYTPIAH
jgi:hypothetical protein